MGKSERSINIIHHIRWSILFKLGGIAANFKMVSLAIDYLGIQDYGIWLTISSVLSWFMLFDIGLGNGLRNKFAKAKAIGNHNEAEVYVSTAYYSIAFVGIGMALCFWLFNYFVDWSVVFNSNPNKSKQLSILVPIVFMLVALQLVAKLIVTIYQADQHHSIQDKVIFFGQVLSLIFVWLLLYVGNKSLVLFGVFSTAIPLTVLVMINIISFNGCYSRYRPKIRLYNKKYLMEITGIGVKFFIIQISAVILFSTDNLIITQLFGPDEVVPYNLAYKYFSIVITGYSILVTPYWSSFTEAYAKEDFVWIMNSVKRIQKIWTIVPIIIIVMILLSNQFYRIWVGESIRVSLLLNISMGLYVLLLTFNMIYIQFVNGIGKIRLQLIVSIVIILLNIPLSIFLARNMEMGSPGVIIATSICLGLPMVLWVIQYKKLINRTAKGIWNMS